MKRSILSATLGVVLTGCATMGQLEEGLAQLVGLPEQEAFKALGYPDAKEQFGSDIVYFWGQTRSTIIFMPQTSSTISYVGNTPIYGTTTTTQAVPVQYSCTIKGITGSDGIIKTWEHNGSAGGCEPYIDRVKAYFKR